MVVTRATADRLTPKDEGVCAEFSVVLDNALCIHKVRVISGKSGLFVAFPNYDCIDNKSGKKRYKDVVHPISNSLRQSIQDKVLSEYDKRLSDFKG